MKISRSIWFVITVFSMLFLGSCVSVKPFQKAYLNDEEMDLAPRKLEYFETSFQTYREGSSGAEGGKIGGGCGCN